MSESSSVIGFLALLIMIAALITIIVALVFGIKGLKTKQYGGFKKTLKIFGIICVAFVVLSIAWGINHARKQTGENSPLLEKMINEELGYTLSLPVEYRDIVEIEEREQTTQAGDFDVGVIKKVVLYTIDVNDLPAEDWGPINRVPIFTIKAYPREWWDERVEEKDTGKLFSTPFIDGEDATSSLGIAVGKNKTYAFTFYPSLSCLDLSKESSETFNTPQCAIIEYARKNVPASFSTFDPAS